MDPGPAIALRRITALLFIAGLLTGCQSPGGSYELAPGAVARMAPLNSAALAVVNAVNRREGAVFSLALQNVIGGAYRLALHQIGNCNSPNGFSAGNAWAPPGAAVPPEEIFPVFFVNMEGSTNLNFYVPGVSVDEPGSLLGRTIVLHQGSVVHEAFPGQPNNRVACGIFAPPGPSLLNRL